MCNSRIQLLVTFRTKCDSCSPDVCRFRWNVQGDNARKNNSETGKRHLSDGRDDHLCEIKKGTAVIHHAPTRSVQLFVSKRGVVSDLYIIQWSVFVNNTWSPPPFLGNRGTRSFQCLRDFICVIECLVDLIQQLELDGVRQRLQTQTQ